MFGRILSDNFWMYQFITFISAILITLIFTPVINYLLPPDTKTLNFFNLIPFVYAIFIVFYNHERELVLSNMREEQITQIKNNFKDKEHELETKHTANKI